MSSRRRPTLVGVLTATVAVAGLGHLASGAWILAKALVAQRLLLHAWSLTLDSGEPVRPWRWADTWPVARLTFNESGRDVLVLAGGSGRTLAFGPGHVSGTPLPGAGGNAVIVGHRDTHFAGLAHVRVGDRLRIETAKATIAYVVTATAIVHETQTGVLGETARESLTLVTCWPFDALTPGGPLRFVVRAEAPEPGTVPGQRPG